MGPGLAAPLFFTSPRLVQSMRVGLNHYCDLCFSGACALVRPSTREEGRIQESIEQPCPGPPSPCLCIDTVWQDERVGLRLALPPCHRPHPKGHLHWYDPAGGAVLGLMCGPIPRVQ